MKCPACSAENPEQAKVCGMCGTGLGQMCPACGFVAPGEFRFCSQCGTKLGGPQSSAGPGTLDHASAERRQLTVLFCDLVGSSSLAERLDPEELREVFLSYRQACWAALERYNGHVAQYFGDGILAYFGYPQAHEDDALRGVSAGLDIVRNVRDLNARLVRERRPELTVRIGIHTGLVVVGDLGSGPTREQSSIVGETPTIAARLQERAGLNGVLISRATHRLVRDFVECRELGPVKFAGLSRPIEVFEAVSAGAVRSRLEARSASELTPLVGRKRELAYLLGCWRQAREGQGQAIFLSGEPGIGKSRLVRAGLDTLAAESHETITYCCAPNAVTSAFFPIIDHIQRDLKFEPDEGSDAQLRKLESALTALSLPTKEAVPFLAPLLSLQTRSEGQAADLSAPARKQKTMEWLLRWVLAQAERRPLLIAVEDAHWADASTIDFIGLLLDQLPTSPILLVLTFRPEFRPPWGFRSFTTQMSLSPLSASHVEEIVEAVTGGKRLPPALHAELVAKANGVPLFVEELTKTVLESGALLDSGEGSELTTKSSGIAVPETLLDSLMSRLDRLNAAKATAQLAAVMGSGFSYELLAAVSPLDDAALQNALEQLVEGEFLHQKGLPPKSSYSFKHALIRDTAYRSLLRSKRQQYHRRIAEALLKQFTQVGDARPELIAHHFTSAGMIAEAVEHWRMAGRRALDRSANVEAAAHFRKALELVAKLPESDSRAETELTLQVLHGAAVTASTGYGAPEAQKIYARAWQLCGSLGKTPQLYTALRGLQAFYQIRGPLKAAREIGEQQVTLAEQSGNRMQRIEAHRALGWCLFCLGQLSEARRNLFAALELYDPEAAREGIVLYGGDARVIGLTNFAWLNSLAGNSGEAVEQSRQAVAFARDLAHPLSLAYALCMSGAVHQSLGDADKTLELAAETEALAAANGFAYWRSWSKILSGWAIARGGAIGDGIAVLKEGLAAYRATGAELFRSHGLVLLAEVCGEAGLVDEAIEHVDEALESAAQNDVHFYEAEAYRVRAALLAKGGYDAAQVATDLDQAVSIARAQGSRGVEVRAVRDRESLGQIGRDNGGALLRSLDPAQLPRE